MPGAPASSHGSGAAFSGVRLTLSVGQAIASGVWTSITWDTETFDTDNYHSLVSNTNRITIPAGFDGYFQIIAALEFPANNTGVRGVQVNKNTTTANTNVLVSTTQGVASVNIGAAAQAVTVERLVGGDWLNLNAFQTIGSNLNYGNTLSATFFTVVRLGS